MSGRHFLVESVSQKFLIEKLRNICCIKRYKVSADFFSLPSIYTLASPLHNKVFFFVTKINGEKTTEEKN